MLACQAPHTFELHYIQYSNQTLSGTCNDTQMEETLLLSCPHEPYTYLTKILSLSDWCCIKCRSVFARKVLC